VETAPEKINTQALRLQHTTAPPSARETQKPGEIPQRQQIEKKG
jgi:hypothetical protein